MTRQERIAAKKAEIENYKKSPMATIDIIFKLEHELNEICDEVLETPFQVISFC